MVRLAFLIGHTSKSKGAHSFYFDRNEFDFWRGFECELSEVGDVFYHDHNIKSYTKRQKKASYELSDYDVVFELHFNAANSKAKGCEALYLKGNDTSKDIATLFTDNYHYLTKSKNRGAKALYSRLQRGYGFVKNQRANGIILEPFFGDNKEDCKLFNIDHFLTAVKKSTT